MRGKETKAVRCCPGPKGGASQRHVSLREKKPVGIGSEIEGNASPMPFHSLQLVSNHSKSTYGQNHRARADGDTTVRRSECLNLSQSSAWLLRTANFPGWMRKRHSCHGRLLVVRELENRLESVLVRMKGWRTQTWLLWSEIRFSQDWTLILVPCSNEAELKPYTILGADFHLRPPARSDTCPG